MIVLMANLILAFIWSILSGRGGQNTFPLISPHKKKSHGVKSGERGGQLTMASSASEARPIQRLGRRSLRRALTSQALRWCSSVKLGIHLIRAKTSKIYPVLIINQAMRH